MMPVQPRQFDKPNYVVLFGLERSLDNMHVLYIFKAKINSVKLALFVKLGNQDLLRMFII